MRAYKNPQNILKHWQSKGLKDQVNLQSKRHMGLSFAPFLTFSL